MSDEKPEQKPEPAAPEVPTPMPKAKTKTPNLALRRLRAGFKPSRGQAIVAVVLGIRIFTNMAAIRRHIFRA